MTRHLVDGRLPPKLLEELQTCYLRIHNYAAGRRLWDGLTPEEQKSLGEAGEQDAFRGDTVAIWKALHKTSTERAVLETSLRLNLMNPWTYERLLREIGESSPAPLESGRLSADQIPTDKVDGQEADLVLVEDQRQAYWLGKEIPIDWVKRHRSPWDYFLKLAIYAQKSRPLTWEDFSSELAWDYHVKMKSRLTGLEGFPEDLAVKIETAGPRAQRLDIPRDRIRILRTNNQSTPVGR